MFHNYIFKSLVTNYINKIRIDSVIFGLLPDVCETCDSLINFPEKKPFLVFCGANHQKRLNFLFLPEICMLCYNLWNKKPKCNIWRPCRKSIPYVHTPTNKHSSNCLPDCMLLMRWTLQEVITTRDTLFFLSQSLGFVINLKKSILQPVKKLEFLGLQINTEEMILSLKRETDFFAFKSIAFKNQQINLALSAVSWDHNYCRIFMNEIECPNRLSLWMPGIPQSGNCSKAYFRA